MDPTVKHRRLSLKKGESLTTSTHTVEHAHPLHWHSYFEIEIILSGKGEYVVNDVVYDITEHHVFLLTSTDFHHLKLNETATILNISFDETMMSDADMTALVFSNVAKAYRFESEEYGRIVNIARALEHEYTIGGDCQRALLSYILKCLLRKNAIVNTDAVGHSLGGIKRAIIYMGLHFRENVTLKSIADVAGYTPTYFSKLFKQATGSSYIETLLKYRLGYARTLLANGFSVTAACFSAGFGSLTNFQEAFKKSYGISPSEYKKNT